MEENTPVLDSTGSLINSEVPQPPKKSSFFNFGLVLIVLALLVLTGYAYKRAVGMIANLTVDENIVTKDTGYVPGEPTKDESPVNDIEPVQNSVPAEAPGTVALIGTSVGQDRLGDIYNDKVEFKKLDKTYIAEAYWLNFVLQKANSNGWSGKGSDVLPVAKSDIPESLITKLGVEEKRRVEAFNIPVDVQKYYYSETSGKEISETIVRAREEFVNFLKTKGVSMKYIDEINNNALPNDGTRLFYSKSNGIDVSTVAEGLIDKEGKVSDYSKRQVTFQSPSFYGATRRLVEVGILGTVPPVGSAEYEAYYKKVMQLAIRYSAFHEFGHVLQRVVDTVNSREDKKTLKSAWVYGTKSMWKVDNNHYLKWSNLETINDSMNITTSKESQTEGISYDALTTNIRMSDGQKKLLWEVLFGRVSDSRDEFDAAMQVLQKNNQDFDISDIQHKVYTDVISKFTPGEPDSKTLYSVNKRLADLPAYQGYFHPRELKDMPKLWDYLKD